MIPIHIIHNGYGGYEATDEVSDEDHIPIAVGLPVQGRPERLHLYRWMVLEESYVADKFDDQRDGHDESMQEMDLNEFWLRQISQYWGRAEAFLQGAKEAKSLGDTEGERDMTLRAQQALVKSMMTCKGMIESSIRSFGNLPKPGVSSGYIESWEG